VSLHLVQPVPATELTKNFEAEAFTARTRVLANMLAPLGTVHVYGGEQHETVGTEYHQIIDRQWQARHFPGFRTSDVFTDYDPQRAPWIEFAVYAADAIRRNAKPGDILGVTMGVSQSMLASLVADLGLTVVEVGVGYKGILAQSHRVYESRAWQTYHAGRAVGMAEARGDANADIFGDVRNFDTVIPRGYEVEDFPAGSVQGGYFLFVGRIVSRKGVLVAAQVCQRLGAKLVFAGQNVTKAEKGRIETSEGLVIEGDVEWVGVVGPEERARLLGGAIATFTPTLYAEPFGGVHAESLLTGTPVIATPHGCFPEYIENGVNGWTCATLAEFVAAAQSAASLDRSIIRRNAIARYGTATVGAQYDAYFARLRTLRREGWYENPPAKVRRAA
jgi:glycosyltransferase involved in cell wall biosynthesis